MSTPRSLALPSAARPETIPTERGRVAALSVGDRSAAGTPTVLLIPGFTGSKEDFLAVLGPLGAAGYPVVAFDQQGQYETLGPEQVGDEVYSLEGFARAACALADAVGGDLHVVGHSFGGLVAQAMALLDPSHVRSITLLCSGPSAVPEEQHGALETFIDGVPLIGKEAAWKLMRQRAEESDPQEVPADVEEFLRRRFVSSATGSLVGIAEILRSAPDRVEELGALGVPVHVVHGDSDDAWPISLQQEMAGRLGAPLTVVADAGHSPAVDQPEATTDAIVGFLRAVETDTRD